MKKYLILLLIIVGKHGLTNAQALLGGDTTGVSYATPKDYIIGGVTVSGAQQLDRGIILALSGLAIGDKIKVPGDKVAQAIDNLWKQGLFENIKITATKIIGENIFLDIALEEKPRLSKFSFKGVKKGEADDLREKINLVKGRVVTDYLVASTKTIITEHFINDGYLNAKTTIATEPDPVLKNNVILVITVDKGQKVRVQDIFFHGNTAITSAKLRRTFKETKVKRWWNVFNSGKYLAENLEADLPAIIEKYNAKGYRDAKIVKDSVSKISDNRVNINITISEGRKYYFRNITWVGNSKHTSQRLNNILGIKKGDVFDQSLLDTRLYMNPNGSDISSLYMDDGYLFFQVSPVEIMIENDSIDMEMRIYEGKQAIINKVWVSGNTKTNDHVIMREIRTRPGQLFRRSDIIRSQRELAQLGYFDAEKLNVNPIPNPANGTVDIEYIVEEKPSDQIELSGGWGGNRIVGTLGITFNNFSSKNMFKKDSWRPLPAGDGQRLSVRAQSNGFYYQSFNASFTEPWLGGRKPNSLSFSAYHTIQATNVLKPGSSTERLPKADRSYMTISGISVGLGTRLKKPDDYFTAYIEGSYQYYVVNKLSSFLSFSDGFANNINLKLNISRNSVDKPIFETSGSKLSFTAQLTPPYSLFNNKNYSDISDQERFKFIEYQKYKFTAAWYTNLTGKRSTEGKEARNLVLYTKAGYGFLGMYNSKVGLAPFERFYLGGSGLSGYALDGREIIALRGYDDQSLSASTGAAFVNKYTMELRFPLSLNPQATIYMLGFAEAGNSWSKAKDYNPFQLKRSAGVGLRIFLPMFGLLGFDYGWRFDDIPAYPGMQKSQFHFTIGAALGEL